ncbi:sensor histidine kinase [Saccharopolyspora dendranthemae]|uniref:histidine kinase n=1 Tax=Saccharopolyspora dendranthemae TaxID=1181886 RepID=A0A561VAD4_9PSEU|nr:ATP-binding protein [Saccharopolyspora dendranthemae]TWG08576.1 histidine kinase/DNA gyrase B/HSP90-like ATPase [Saccharopolyspora dendranthemae]
MRAQEKRAVEAVADHLAGLCHAPDAFSLAQVIGTALGATGCALTISGERHQWGRGEDRWLSEPVEYDGQVQAVLAVAPETAGPLDSLAAVLGPPLVALRLAAETDQLRRDGDAAARELVDDRWRTTVEMEQERRGLERDLHDGAQHHLVALKMSMALVEHTGATQERLAELESKLDAAEKALTDTAAGILPIPLSTEGLAGALRAELDAHPDVALDTTGFRRRYPPLVESTVYFACLEAVNNAHKHAPGASIRVAVRDNAGGLEFVVSDNGPGFTITGRNKGLPNLSARMATVGGTIDVRSAPGQGTTITAFVPG